MAIYSVQVKSLSRGKGDSATAAAAYRAGLDLDDPSGTRHAYSRKTGVLSVDMLAPKGAPTWALDPHQVWAKVEEHETRKNARVAREVLMALPHELDPEQRRELARDVGQLLVDRYGVVAQVALHAPDKGGDGRNYHAHILLTPRVVGAEGFGDSAARVLDEYKAGAQELKDLRAAVGERINAALADADVSARVDHRSLIDQKAEAVAKNDFAQVVALDRPATRHEGKAVTQARRRGERLPRARRNDRVRHAAEQRADAHAERFEALKAQAAAEGRLAHVDEQALHARALLERSQAGRARLRHATISSPTPGHAHAPNNRPQRFQRASALTRDSRHPLGLPGDRHPRGLQPLPAVRALDRASAVGQPPGAGHAQGRGGFAPVDGGLLRPDAPGHRGPDRPVQRLQSKPVTKPARAVPQRIRPTGGTRVVGNGTKEGEQVARLANLWLAQLEKDIAELIRRALAWAQNHREPLPRALARDYLQAEGEAQLATVVRTQATADLKLARRARLDARYYRDQGQVGLKGKDKLARRLGWTPKTLRDLQDAVKQSEEAVVQAKHAEHSAIAAQATATAEAERHRQRLMDGFLKAHPEQTHRFPKQRPLTALVISPAPSPVEKMGAASALQPPRLEPPRFTRPKPPGR
ncbi:MobA/MobL family protein [Stenotrophomonas forensis]